MEISSNMLNSLDFGKMRFFEFVSKHEGCGMIGLERVLFCVSSTGWPGLQRFAKPRVFQAPAINDVNRLSTGASRWSSPGHPSPNIRRAEQCWDRFMIGAAEDGFQEMKNSNRVSLH